MNLERDPIQNWEVHLAEVILEDFYERKSFGLITTHYANLKAFG
jgi:dsDNA-specific endonuclease/ATPase MutS2